MSTNQETYPLFYESLYKHFPHAIDLKTFCDLSSKAFNKYGFTKKNTLGMVAICRDEMTGPVYSTLIQNWDKTFNCGGLGGFVFMGKTGLDAAVDHAPYNEDQTRRFVFYVFPHIGISKGGLVGKIEREGIDELSAACGALCKIVNELEEHRKIQFVLNMNDLEESLIRQKLVSHMNYGDVKDIVGLTKLALEVITEDIRRMLTHLDMNKVRYGVVTGVQIHGVGKTFIWPSKTWVRMGPNQGFSFEPDVAWFESQAKS